MNRSLPIHALIVLGACRLDPGDPVYPDFQPFLDSDALQGELPFVEGDERLSVGVFYEGGRSETIDIDGSTTNYFIFEGTYDQTVSDDRVEGLLSDEIQITNAQLWWGGGVIWDPARDLTGWTTLRISLKATDGLFETMTVGISLGGVDQVVTVTDYGFAADGSWHTLVIPLADIGATDLTNVTSPLLLLNTQGTTGSTLLVDDVFFTKE
ncbi:MAG: hypothetical protein KTR31_20960 [Myxococcales bacterium]|nr:hypothetical protein [Myxococcales bacterium]